MPRKAFKDDLAQATTTPSFHNITQVEASEDDGLAFSYWCAETQTSVRITALVPDASQYPTSHEYMVFADDDAPLRVAMAVASVSNFHGKPIAAFLLALSDHLSETTSSDTNNPQDIAMIDSDGDVELPDPQTQDSEDSDFDDEDMHDWAMYDDDDHHDDPSSTSRMRQADNSTSTSRITTATEMIRARIDLNKAKAAGFKIGYVGKLQPGSSCYLSVAIRVAKLGISEDAMEAWNLHRDRYLVLVMHFPSGYQSLDALLAQTTSTARRSLQLAVGISSTYKPRTVQEALRLFSSQAQHTAMPVPTSTDKGLHESFISRPLFGLLNDRMLEIIRTRLKNGFGWSQAERWVNENQGQAKAKASTSDKIMEEDALHSLSQLAIDDELRRGKDAKELSLPLIAFQFLIRHFAGCTEFCLVCFCALETRTADAIKPYVCEKPLCLYQFVSLGFGPSIEHEILTQGCTIDLLLSFAFAAASTYKLRDFPHGLSLTVPDIKLMQRGWLPSSTDLYKFAAQSASSASAPKISGIYHARMNLVTHTLFFDPESVATCPMQVGSFIVVDVSVHKSLPDRHYRVKQTSDFPIVHLASEFTTYPSPVAQTEPIPSGTIGVSLHLYNQNFDALEKELKCQVIILLMTLMPFVSEMRAYLESRPGATLATWHDRMSPAQVSLLRWVVASNRACIVQVDQPDGYAGAASEQRVQGAQGMLQFRFAMGAPDKEARFNSAIKSNSASKIHPTIFAWHGSRLENWHSIIRHGLNFENIVNGRAYGNGVYFAKDFHTSNGFSSHSDVIWPKSELGISAAVALNELVNAPQKFASCTPYYVVHELDWIQTRILFVRPTMGLKIQPDSTLSVHLAQDPARTPIGPDGRPIALPITTIPKSRRTVDGTQKKKKQKSKLTVASLPTQNARVDDLLIGEDDDSGSVMTDWEDLELLLEPDAEPQDLQETTLPDPGSSDIRATKITDPIIPFVAGTHSNIPLMPPPPYATSIATKRLQKDFRILSQMQNAHKEAGALHDLGWWLDEDHLAKTENLYAWIVELHSFPLTLPLAMDMEKRGLASVVFEMRFHASYPISPPFIRVVRPRFLPFAMGGGGHVTAGGSICMDLLTNSGWSAANSLESVLLQIRMAILSTDPRPARLQPPRGYSANDEYGVGEAVEAFRRACLAHGWVVPEGLNEIALT